jgi:hypothetical protein
MPPRGETVPHSNALSRSQKEIASRLSVGGGFSVWTGVLLEVLKESSAGRVASPGRLSPTVQLIRRDGKLELGKNRGRPQIIDLGFQIENENAERSLRSHNHQSDF